MSTISDLAMLARMDSVEALSVGAADQDSGRVPEWSELVLNLEYDDGVRTIPMTRHDGELIIEVLHSVLHPNTNKQSPVQRLWGLLDDTMDFLMADDDPEPEDKARARALAEAISLLTQPWSEELDISDVRIQAHERWEERDE